MKTEVAMLAEYREVLDLTGENSGPLGLPVNVEKMLCRCGVLRVFKLLVTDRRSRSKGMGQN